MATGYTVIASGTRTWYW